MQSGISEEFNCRVEGIVQKRNPENSNICEGVIGHYEFRYLSDEGLHQASLKLLIQTLQESLASYEAAGIK